VPLVSNNAILAQKKTRMANKRKDIMEIKQILLQLTKKVSNRKIAKQLGMSRNTVNE
jgi:biotin operon repressor